MLQSGSYLPAARFRAIAAPAYGCRCQSGSNGNGGTVRTAFLSNPTILHNGLHHLIYALQHIGKSVRQLNS